MFHKLINVLTKSHIILYDSQSIESFMYVNIKFVNLNYQLALFIHFFEDLCIMTQKNMIYWSTNDENRPEKLIATLLYLSKVFTPDRPNEI